MTRLRDLPAIGEKRALALESDGITALRELIERLPASYRDCQKIMPVASLAPGMSALFEGRLTHLPSIRRVGGLCVVTARFTDDTGEIQAVYFNQPYLRSALKVGKTYALYARITLYKGQPCALTPVMADQADVGTIVPIYRQKYIPQKTYRKLVRKALADTPISDAMPQEILSRNGLLDLQSAYCNAHFPVTQESLLAARRRLAFDELLYFQLALSAKCAQADKNCVRVPFKQAVYDEFLAALPFGMTGAQKRVIAEIFRDLSGSAAMARLVQGDVGCGKTAVAQAAMFMCARQGYQSALMAPTEVLANQHWESFKGLFEKLGLRVGLLTGSMTKKQHQLAKEAIASGTWDMVIGTHALITQDVAYKNLGLVVTDEQHRFGVRQRLALSEKGEGVNVLVMSATPIPRTLQLILFGDLDISVVDELPPGRIPVRTHIVREEKRADMYSFLKGLVEQGRQGYVVCPMIEASEELDMVSAQETFEAMRRALPHLRIILAHGGMKNAEKQEMLRCFYAHEADILVSTTIIEVGMNVPNASFMVIEQADRFGLAQLHQLRGRVGRGSYESYCFLLSDQSEKLKILTKTADGFLIAEEDLNRRGPGEILGVRQSGLLDAGIAGGIGDAQLLEKTHNEAKFIQQNRTDPVYEPLFCDVMRVYESRIKNVGIN